MVKQVPTPSAEKLVSWYSENKRDLPWRRTKDPYAIWLSEVILQQTQVAQGLPYYLSFLEAFPDVHSLAMADEQTVLKLWQGLGYYSRARNLHKAAKLISQDLRGIMPSSYTELLRLPGVGPYTAAAIASICYNEEVPVVDGNVQRLISRHFLVTEAVNSGRGMRTIRAIAEDWIWGQKPSEFNQAMMELGATVCRPKRPLCAECPLQGSCQALRDNKVEELPVKHRKKPPVNRYMHYRISITQNRTWIVQRKGMGIWEGLYEWPNEEIGQDEYAALESSIPNGESGPVSALVHVLSHQKIHALFSVTRHHPTGEQESTEVRLDQLDRYPMSRLMTRFIESYEHLFQDDLH